MTEPNSVQGEYPIRLEAFEGPLDLLLYLIKKDEVDIYDIPIESIARQFHEYLQTMELLDLSVAGEFLVMSATLMHIKSRLLLPEEERPSDLEPEEDPRWDLVRQLIEYKKFRDAALHLEKLEDGQHNILLPSSDGVEFGQEPGLAIRDVGLFDLVRTLTDVLARARQVAPHEIKHRPFTVAEKISHIVSLIESLAEDEGVSLLSLFEGMEYKMEMICTFLATLELTRMHKLRVVQVGTFGDIQLRKPAPQPAVNPEELIAPSVPEAFLRERRRRKPSTPAEPKAETTQNEEPEEKPVSLEDEEDWDDDDEDEDWDDDEDEDDEDQEQEDDEDWDGEGDDEDRDDDDEDDEDEDWDDDEDEDDEE